MRIRRLITICLAVAVASMCFSSLASATDGPGGWQYSGIPGGWQNYSNPYPGWQAGGSAPSAAPKSAGGVDGLALAAIAGGLTLLVGGTAMTRRRRRGHIPAGVAA